LTELGVSPRQRGLALGVAAALLAAGVLGTAVANHPLLPVPGYMTAFGAAMIVINLILAALLYSKGVTEKRADPMRLGTAYLFVGAIFVPLVASFPNALVPGSIIGTSTSPVWLWSFWHAGFGLAIIRYAWCKGRSVGIVEQTVPRSVAAVIAIVAALAMTATVFLPYLPPLFANGRTFFSGGGQIVPFTILALNAAALGLVLRLGARTSETLWLAVAMLAACVDIWLTYCGSDRFSVGWYASKAGSLVTSLVVLVSQLHDITKLYREAAEARAEAEHASEAKSEFLAAMSHEVRTPLHGIIGYTDLLLEQREALSPDQRLKVERIQTAGDALLCVVNDILDFSKVEAGKVTLNDEPFAPAALVDHVASIARGSAEGKGLGLLVEIDPRVPASCLGDEARLRQVLLNFVNNAVKFTPTGEVRIELSLAHWSEGSPEQLMARVVDTGIGLTEAQRARLFERFAQADGTVHRTHGGTGLGLAISKQLIALMGGSVGVESAPGRGSTFWFAVPLRVAPDRSERTERLPLLIEAALVGNPSPKRLLLAEDVVINQEIARAVLQKAGHTVDVVSDGAAALEAVQSKTYDLVLMDVQMPGMDGLTATRHIRALSEPARSVPILAMSANVLAPQVRAFREAGMDGHVGKPFKREELLRAVDETARQSLCSSGEEPSPVDEVDGFDRARYSELLSLIGAGPMAALMEKLEAELKLRLLDNTPRERLAPDAHALASPAGMLGFTTLAACCQELEAACATGAAATDLVARTGEARVAALATLTMLRRAS
jgi:signal transduction histidine kinase/CheY-like chemotaxis protein